MSTDNMPSGHKDLILEALRMRSSIDEKKDLDRMRKDQLTMLKNKTMETYTGLRGLEDTLTTLTDILDFLSGRSG